MGSWGIKRSGAAHLEAWSTARWPPSAERGVPSTRHVPVTGGCLRCALRSVARAAQTPARLEPATSQPSWAWLRSTRRRRHCWVGRGRLCPGRASLLGSAPRSGPQSSHHRRPALRTGAPCAALPLPPRAAQLSTRQRSGEEGGNNARGWASCIIRPSCARCSVDALSYTRHGAGIWYLGASCRDWGWPIDAAPAHQHRAPTLSAATAIAPCKRGSPRAPSGAHRDPDAPAPQHACPAPSPPPPPLRALSPPERHPANS